MYKMPLSLERLVRAFCGEYSRMCSALQSPAISPIISSEYQYIVDSIYSAVLHATDLRGCQIEELIKNISYNTGYDKTELRNALGKNKYYKLKKRAVYRIAENLHLA